MTKEKNLRTFLKDVEQKFKGLGNKAKDLAVSLEKDAVFGAKVSKLKFEEIELEFKRKNLYRDLGEKTYALIKSKKITLPLLTNIFEKLTDIDNEIKNKKVLISKYKKDFLKSKNKKKI